ncbi:hypothetical protein Kpol_1002p27 [Vanderwaltozyma polyspora DSM 70294]|uniref:mRNA-capping enzyme subunit beta n=1 Tax=Vanderwaltozyma polyspora (strain ATCC 22028 / DSM 70294 / BCRC 21397 / CBS 2163 / NBRC 10782 / NRRL Y-8283 / UCD 57-17) TaxID=436907 RepID=A7TE59_VANPO|nr:uncharacterized protein Kpol_1002p27 [Vanderwaltozyma polyspora DSM 70294]EDO19381.1 hypothetical protein Kpol_1002p27 [Vanderwaltozyma polyspora DSM 70294]
MSSENAEVQAKPTSTKRALSLDDLVNHDENDNLKLQKISQSVENERLQNNNTVQSSNPISNVIIPQEVIVQPQPQQPVVKSTSSVTSISSMINNDSETDTDDEVGEINFDSGMAFDYDKQDTNFVERPKPKAVTPKQSKPKPRPKSRTTTPTSPAPAKTQQETVPVVEVKKEIPSQPVEEVTKETKEDQSNQTKDIPVEKPKEEKIEEEKQPIDTNDNKNEKESEVNNIFEEKVTSKSKRNNIKKELSLLNEIAATSKPNKYKNTPIWAQKWKPTVKALQSIDTKDFKIDQSFLNFIPDDDLTKSVQDWAYATIFSIPPELRTFIEMEMKFGLIIDAKGPDRVNPPISSQAVYTELDAHMVPNVDEVLFKELIKYVQGISELNENRGKFNIIESHTTDSLYRVGVASQRPRFLRMSTDMKTGRIGQFIEKRHISQLMLYSPKDSYDVKISINLELPVPENEPPEKYKDQSPINERSKERISYIHNDSCTRIDITKVINNKLGSKNKETETTHEIELEMNTPALLSAFENITNDSTEYASIIRTFLSNGTIIRRKLSTLSYEIFEGTKKIM